MRHAITLISGIALALLVGTQPRAQAPSQSPITVEHSWARATPGGAKTAAVYVTLINKGDAADQLMTAATPISDKVQFHKESEENGVSRMRLLPALDIAPGATVTFTPGDMHIMLVGLKQPLREGQTFPLTLEFRKAGKVDVVVSVAKIGAMGRGDTGSMTHEHDGAAHQ